MLRLFIFFLTLFISVSSFAHHKIKYVIYMTFDGTRWQEVFEDRSFFKIFWEKYADKMNLYGAPNSNTDMSVASIPVSLPSYQSQMAGSVQFCLNNECGRIKVLTFPENIKNTLGLRMQDVAVFSSWYEITHAVEHIEGSVFTNTGNFPVYDPNTHVPDAVMYDLNLAQAKDHPHGTTRYDRYTFAQAMHYFETYLPRLLWISLNDSDDAAHGGNLEGYQSALRFFDGALDQVFQKLNELHIEDQTMIVVTTDHGRGNGEYWTDHGIRIRASKKTWAFVYNGELQPRYESNGITFYSTLSVRPTIEEAMLF